MATTSLNPGVGPTNADIATAVAAPSAATIAAAVAAPSAATIASAVAAPSAATIAATVAAPSAATIAAAVAAPSAASIVTAGNAAGWNVAGGPYNATWANVAVFNGNAGGTITLSSLTGYKYLRVFAYVEGLTSSGRYRIRFNGDTSSNYTWGAATSSARDGSFNLTSIYTSPSNTTGFDFFVFDIPFANSSTVEKIIQGQSSNSTNNLGYFAGVWRSNAAITSISIDNTAGASFNSAYIRVIGAN